MVKGRRQCRPGAPKQDANGLKKEQDAHALERVLKLLQGPTGSNRSQQGPTGANRVLYKDLIKVLIKLLNKELQNLQSSTLLMLD